MKRKSTIVVLIVLALVVVLVIVGSELLKKYTSTKTEKETEETTVAEGYGSDDIEIEDEDEDEVTHLRDRDELYETSDPYSVETMYLTVSYGNATEGTNHTWEEVNTHSVYYYEELGIARYKVAALLQVGDENGPVKGELGYGLTTPNATVQVRGQTSSNNTQKNYKIKLVDSSSGWNGQKTIALNKHEGDALRFRNKLAYDLISEIPEIMGLRTQFVHLYVRDTTGDNPDAFVDYGLYTQVEQLNKKALKTHGLESNGYLYKINYFEFYKYDEILPVDDPNYDETKFSEYLECKGREDHTRLIEMLDDVNNDAITSDDLLDTWFDRENLAYWMAFMLLTGNSDTQSRNVYIYSGVNDQRWYFYPWDNDATFMDMQEEIGKRNDFDDWEDGVTNYWCNILFKRALLSSSFREELTDAIEDLYHNQLNPQKVYEQAKKYAEVVLPYVYTEPDIKHENYDRDEYQRILDAIPDEIEYSYKRYYESLKSPMPFYVSNPEVDTKAKTTNFFWDTSICIEESDVTYDIWLSKDYNGNGKIFEENDLMFPNYTYNGTLEEGQYFFHVAATNKEGLTTNCFDLYSTEDGAIYGIYSFYVDAKGKITAWVHHEGEEYDE